jgi:hypothetical protein
MAVRTRGIDSAGDVIDRDHGCLGVDRTWCESQEELRGLGIRPDAFTIACLFWLTSVVSRHVLMLERGGEQP